MDSEQRVLEMLADVCRERSDLLAWLEHRRCGASSEQSAVLLEVIDRIYDAPTLRDSMRVPK